MSSTGFQRRLSKASWTEKRHHYGLWQTRKYTYDPVEMLLELKDQLAEVQVCILNVSLRDSVIRCFSRVWVSHAQSEAPKTKLSNSEL